MDFVDFNLAKKLKEKGFKYNKNNLLDRLCMENQINHPSIHQVLKWLREEKNIYCLPYFEQGVDMWFYAICKPTCGSEFPEFVSKSDYDTYEQAVIAGVNYCLENLI